MECDPPREKWAVGKPNQLAGTQAAGQLRPASTWGSWPVRDRGRRSASIREAAFSARTAEVSIWRSRTHRARRRVALRRRPFNNQPPIARPGCSNRSPRAASPTGGARQLPFLKPDAAMLARCHDKGSTRRSDGDAAPWPGCAGMAPGRHSGVRRGRARRSGLVRCPEPRTLAAEGVDQARSRGAELCRRPGRRLGARL